MRPLQYECTIPRCPESESYQSINQAIKLDLATLSSNLSHQSSSVHWMTFVAVRSIFCFRFTVFLVLFSPFLCTIWFPLARGQRIGFGIIP